MNQVSEIAVESPACVAQVNTPSGLNVIVQPKHAGVTWHREVPPNVQTSLDDVDPDFLPLARHVCTYRGSGAQFGISQGEEAPDPVCSVDTSKPMVLRGRLWPTEPPSGLLHRAPPIEGTGMTQLVLVLDAVAEPGEVL